MLFRSNDTATTEIYTRLYTLSLHDALPICDLAVHALAAARAGEFSSVFIDGEPALEARYGLRVPVLRDAAGRELDWPFDAAALAGWLGAAAG